MSIIFPYPVMYKDGLDYDEPKSYDSKLWRVGKQRFQITHMLINNNLVADLVSQGLARFFCTISVGGTIFRKTEMLQAIKTDVTDAETICRQQEVDIPYFHSAMNIFVRPGVVLMDEQTISTDKAHGVSDSHKNSGSILFPAQSIIAFTDWWRSFSIRSLFVIESDTSLGDGVFRPELLYATVFKIKICMSPKLADEMDCNHGGKTSAHVLCSSLAQMLEKLQQLYIKRRGSLELLEDEDEYQELEQAEGLKAYISARGLNSWEDDNFNASLVASELYPATLPAED